MLVTGGAGYIGSHASKSLARAGFLPVAYDSLIYGHEWAVKWGPLEHGDISDRSRLDDYRNNVAGSLTLIEAARDAGIDRFVFSSTCATYGIPDQLPIRETSPQRPINPWGEQADSRAHPR